MKLANKRCWLQKLDHTIFGNRSTGVPSLHTVEMQSIDSARSAKLP